ncbi:MAG TPA: hypothetical protein VGA51_00185 [Casimicrobiaceae bacterium]
MRTLVAVLVVIFVGGCATVPAGERIAVYDHKNNTTRYAYRSADSEFVGTSDKAGVLKTKPSRYQFGHP